MRYLSAKPAESSERADKSLLVGDEVDILIGEDGANNTIEKIYPRRSELMRPPVANLDRLFILSSVRDPNPSTLIIDKMTAIACWKNIEPVIVII